MGSLLRNPVIASVFYDLEFAETKGTGIRTMRRLLDGQGLAAPVFNSYQLENQFTSIYLLHQLLGEEQLRWLQQFSHLQLTGDEAKALILAAETGGGQRRVARCQRVGYVVGQPGIGSFASPASSADKRRCRAGDVLSATGLRDDRCGPGVAGGKRDPVVRAVAVQHQRPDLAIRIKSGAVASCSFVGTLSERSLVVMTNGLGGD
ncbi:ATP-binding protein [Pseudomonas gingeri]|uniref:ATP-binding protein n=1 Tax=Pseudomonas gingeri TaxID=117681 RepID=UPI00210D86A8|nr:ATP-binding protein [Pseudomonas gingeri]